MTGRRILAAAVLLLAACNRGFEPQYRVADVRILAVRDSVPGSASADGSTVADIAPGDAVLLEALVANPQHRAGLTVGWFTCLPPANQALTPCDDRYFLDDPSRLASTPGVIPLGVNVFPAAGTDPSVVASIAPPITDPATVTSLALALGFALDTAASNTAYQCRLFTELPLIIVAEAEGVRSLARKQVRLASAAANAAHDPPLPPFDPTGALTFTTNTNPLVVDVLRGAPDPDACATGASLSSPPFAPGRINLCGIAATAQTYSVCDPDPRALPETLAWQWYVTAGEFPDEGGGVGNATGQNVDFTPPGTPFSLWAIVRDGRGGTGWTRWDFAAPP